MPKHFRNLSKLSRRDFLKALGVGVAALPFVPQLEAMAQSRFPTRLVVFFSANGTIHENWRPGGEGQNFTFSPILQPLEPFRDKLLILDGVACESATSGPGDDHQKGMGHILTGTELLNGDEFPGCGGECAGSGWGGGVSVDQYIADRVGQSSQFRSLELGVQTRNANIWSRMSYRDANNPVPPRDNPYDAFGTIFGGLDTDTIGLDRLIRERRSAIDSVIGDLNALSGKVGVADKRKIEAHLDAVRALERRLDVSNDDLGAACEIPMIGDRMDHNANDNFPAVGRIQTEMLVMALACNLTRVASLQWSTAVSNTRFTWLASPIDEGHHDISHVDDNDASAKEKLTRVNHWYAEQFAYLLARLDAVPEGDGTLLDNCMVVWVNELAKGNVHSHFPVPFVVGGRAGGTLDTGRFLDFGRTPHNNLLVSMCHAMGVDTETFGNRAFCTGPLSGLTV